MTAPRSVLSSFRTRLIIGYALLVAAIVAVWAWSLYGPITTAAIDQQRADLVTIARVAALGAAGQTPADAASSIAKSARTQLRVTIVATDGVVLADSAENASQMDNHAGRPEVASALRGQVGTATRLSATTGTKQMYVAMPATVGGKAVVLRVSEPLALVEGLADRGRQSGLILLLLTLGAAIVIAVRISARAAEPVRRLRDAAEAMAAGDLGVGIPHAEGEVGDLADSLASLRDRIRTTLTEMEHSEELLRAALDGLQDAVFLFEGDRIVFANRTAVSAFRVSGSPDGGAAIADASFPASLEEAVRDGLEAGTGSVRELGPDPEGRYQRVTLVPLNASATGTRTLAVITDTTTSQNFDAMRRDFVSNASHELKTPVAGIKLLAEMAGTALQDGDAEQARAFVVQLGEEAERLRRLVADLLDLARLEHGHGSGAIAEVRGLLDNALLAHRSAASASGLDLTLDVSQVAGQDVYAAADATDLAVALDNLLSNAIAYTAEGGVTVRLDATPEIVTIAVSDTGPGIAAEHLPRIFERFYRVDAARSRDVAGTGLGLALVRNAVEAAGGEIDVASTVGVGTTFTMRLPRARGARGPRAAERPQPRRRARSR